MIDWQRLYNLLLDTKYVDNDGVGEYHHVVPYHVSLDRNDVNVVKLSHRYHTLAHYIRYRWFHHDGDKLAYMMMSGQLLNPMHILEIKNKVAEQTRTPERRNLVSNRMTEYFSYEENRLNQSNKRKEYINNMSEDEFNEFRYRRICQKMYDNRAKALEEYFSDKSRIKASRDKAASTLKKKLSELSKEEIQKIYSRGNGINNPRWKGYYLLIKDDEQIIFNTKTELYHKSRLKHKEIDEYVLTGEKINDGLYMGYKLINRREL